MYALALEYYNAHGDLLIPCEYIAGDGSRLGRWIGTQRSDAKKGRPSVTPLRRQKLEAIGMVWDVKELEWERMYASAQAFQAAHGSLSQPDFAGAKLSEWLSAQRKKRKNGTLSSEKAERLEALGLRWSPARDQNARWEKNYAQCLEYILVNGGTHVPRTYFSEDGKSLGQWLCRQKAACRAGKLSPARREKIERFSPERSVKSARWADWYHAAEEYRRQHGHLLPPPGTKCRYGDLHAWINIQRLACRSGSLSQERQAKLETLGMIWQVREAYWERMYLLAAQYSETHEKLMPSPSEYPELASWISNQRARRRAGKSSLTAERIQKLDAIGMIWEPLQHSWEANFRLAQDFFRENGHLDIHRGHALFPWLAQQRTAKRLGTLSAAREARLNKIGMCWNVIDASWERMYAAAAEYYRFHGLLNIPTSYVTRDGLRLGAWIGRQRRTYKDRHTLRDPKIDARIQRLNEIGMIWDASGKIYFTSFPEQAVMYFVRRYFPSARKLNRWEEYGIEIDVFIPELMVGIEYDGVFHQSKKESDERKNRICAENQIRLFRIREPELPILDAVGDVYFLSGSTVSELETALQALLTVLGVQALPGEIDISRERQNIIEAYRDLNAPAWDRMYEKASQYYALHGSLKIAKANADREALSVNDWITRQRRCYYEALLTKRQAGLLMKLHFLDGAAYLPRRRLPSPAAEAPPYLPLSSKTKASAENTGSRPADTASPQSLAAAKWEEMFRLAEAFSHNNAHLLVTPGNDPSGGALRKWLLSQRRRYRLGSMSTLEIERLERLGMVWNPKQAALDQWLCAAKDYYRVQGDINAPLNYVNANGQRLGSWIANMRAKYRAGKLSPQLAEQLEQLKICWYPLNENWEQMYRDAADFYKRHGHLNVPDSYAASNGKPLAVWLYLQRQKYWGKEYIKGSLSREQAERLVQIGMDWEPYESIWLKNYKLAKEYWARNGHLRVPSSYVAEDGTKLGMWIGTQRQAYRGNPNYHITEKRVALLNEIGMLWNPDGETGAASQPKGSPP